MDLTASLQGIDAPSEARVVESHDGTRVAAYRLGRGPIQWVMPPAMGAPLLAMKTVIEGLVDRCTVYTWDMRGFFGSGAAPDPDAYRIGDHVADLDAVVRAYGVKDFLLGGWSMAVQLSLERYHRHPGDVRALVLINGPYQRALEAIAPGFHPLLSRALGVAPRIGPQLNAASLKVLGAPGAARVLGRLGVFTKNVDLADGVLQRFCQVDWGRYFTVTRHLHDHSAEAWLPDVRMPTLITSGTRDFLTPPRLAKRMHKMIPGSELFIVPRATHYIPVEFGDLLAQRIADFLDGIDRVPRA